MNEEERKAHEAQLQKNNDRAQRAIKLIKRYHDGEINKATVLAVLRSEEDRRKAELEELVRDRQEHIAGALLKIYAVAAEKPDFVIDLFRCVFNIDAPEFFFLHAAAGQVFNEAQYKRLTEADEDVNIDLGDQDA